MRPEGTEESFSVGERDGTFVLSSLPVGEEDGDFVVSSFPVGAREGKFEDSLAMDSCK